MDPQVSLLLVKILPNAHVTRNFLFVNDVVLVTQPVQEIAGYRGGLVEVRRPHHQCMLYSATFHLGEKAFPSNGSCIPKRVTILVLV